MALWGCDHHQCHPTRLCSARGALGAARQGEWSGKAGTPQGIPLPGDSDTGHSRVSPLWAEGSGDSRSVPLRPQRLPLPSRQPPTKWPC